MPSPSRPSQSRPSQNVQRPCPLDDFFAFKPQPLKKGPTPTSSSSTRGPQDFDKHLIDDMILKRVVVVPQMADDFMAIAQAAVDSHERLPGNDDTKQSFLDQDILAENLEKRARVINKECDIQEYYEGGVAQFCATVAATLAFKSEQWDTDSLKWVIKKTDKRRTKGTLPFQFPTGFGTRAHADGFLLATDHGARHIGDLALISRYFDCLLPYEFKNWNFGELKFMEALLLTSLRTPFGWSHCDLGEKCRLEHNGATGCKMGPDAHQSQLPSVRHIKEHPDDAQPYMRQLPPQARARRAIDDIPDENGVPKKAYYMLQQAWSDLCDNDATYIIITAGNGELVGERDRENQTLYLSGFINVPNTQYFKLHTGIFIAAIRDAANRATLLSLSVPRQWTRRFDILVDFTLPQQQDLPELVLQEFQKRPWLVLQADDGSGAPAGPFFQNEFYRRFEIEGDALRIADEDSFARVTVLSHPKDRYSQPRHSKGLINFKKCVLPMNWEPSMTVFIKTAVGELEVANLRHEYGLHLYLCEQGVPHIPRVYGYFEYESGPRGIFGVLILQYMGMSVRRWLASSQLALPAIKVARRDVFEKALLSMLDAGFAFPDISLDNLLISGEGMDCIGVSGLERVQDVRWHETYPEVHQLQIQRELRNLFPDNIKRPIEFLETAEEQTPKRRCLVAVKPLGLPLKRSHSLPWPSLSSVRYVVFETVK